MGVTCGTNRAVSAERSNTSSSRILRVASVTHRGLKREDNEDCLVVGCAVAQQTTPQVSVSDIRVDGPVLCMVADGMGGHSCGEVASRFVAERFKDLSGKLPPSEEALDAAIQDVNGELYACMGRAAAYRGMGTTVAGLLFYPDGCLCFNVGDSSVFRVCDGYLEKISIDDVPARARTGILTQALGGAPEFARVVPHLRREADYAGRSYLVCSDGLTDMVSLDEMEECLTDDPGETVQKLLDAALDNGGADNVTILFVQAEPGGGIDIAS